MVVVLGAPVFTYHVHSEGPFMGAGTELFQLVDDPQAAAMAPIGTAVLTTLRAGLEQLLALMAGAAPGIVHRALAADAGEPVPVFQVDPSWPQLPNGDVGGRRQTYRVTIAGQLIVTNYGNYFPSIDNLYFYQSQSFTNAP